MSLPAQPPSRTSKSKFNPDQDPRAAFPNLEDYLAIKNACLADYKDTSPPTELQLKECAKYLSEWSGVQVIDQWKLGEPSGRPAAVLEVAVRYMSGCTIFRVSPEAALYTLDAFHQASTDYVGHLAARSDVARAHSCAAHAHFQKFRASDAERMSYAADERHYRRGQTLGAGLGHPAHTSLKFALHHASESARLGHVSAIVLRIGFAAREIGEGVGVDAGLLAHRAKTYRPLWRAVDDRLNELYAEARNALAFDSEAAARDAPEHACGAEGCRRTRSTSSGAPLKACSGKCSPDLRLCYCSKPCQVKDWSRHKAICRPGYGGKIPKIQNKLIALALFELEDPEPEPTPPPPPVRKAKPKSPYKSPPRDVRPQDDTVDCTADDKKVPEGDEVAAECAVDVLAEHPGAAAGRPATPEIESSQDVQDNEEPPSSPDSECALVAPPSISLKPPSNPDDGLFDSDGLSRCTGDDEPTTSAKRYSAEEVPEETAENVADEAIEDDDAMAVANCARCGPDEDEGSEDPRDPSDDGLSSPDSDHAPLTPPGLPNPPGRVFFGSISPEYLKTMWEEEGPGTWTDTGVWASKVPAVFVVPS